MKSLVERMASWPDFPDREAWLAATAKGDGFSDPGPAAGLRPISLRAYTDCHTKYLEFLNRRYGGVPQVVNVGDRLRGDDLRAFWRELKARVMAPITIRNIFMGILQVARLVDPGSDRAVLEKAIANMVRTAKPVRNIEARILPPETIIREAKALIALAEVGAGRSPTLREAVSFRDGVLLLGGILCPLRPSNWAMAVIDQHLFLEPGNACFRFSAAEMKGRKDRTFPVPLELAIMLQCYIERYRPVLLRNRHDTGHLWLSSSGRSMKTDVLSDVILSIMKRRLNVHFSMHCFRASAASFVADVAPERGRIATKALDHDSFRTTAKHYIRGQQRNALRKYQAAVKTAMQKGKRRKARKSPSEPPRKSG